MTQTQGPLSGVRVLDLSRVLAGPWATQMLADLGAEVIKIERPGVGDDGRGYGTAWIKGKDGIETRQSSFFTVSNRNKRSITVNHSKPEGQEIIRKLAETADVLIENYKVGDLKRFGLDYETLKAINPRLVYCSVTGFGQTGPSAALPGYDGLFQENMVVSVESYIGEQGGGEGVKLEEQVLITANGPIKLSRTPLVDGDR